MKEGTHSMMTRHYKVAGHTFAVSSQAGFFELMGPNIRKSIGRRKGCI